MENEVKIWDRSRPRSPWSLTGGCRSAIFTRDGQNLITCGSGLLARWPIQRLVGQGTNEVRFGPRQIIRQGLDFRFAALSADDRWVAAANNDGGAISVYEILKPANAFALVSHPSTAYPGISPDGKWVASGTWEGSGVRIWQVESRRVVCDLPTAESARVCFSPDNRWLVTGGTNYGVWEVGSWKHKYTLSRTHAVDGVGSIAFTPDGQMLAVVRSPGVIDLVVPNTGDLLARLEAPRTSNIYSLRFAPDEGQLFALEWDQQIQMWDLRRMRAELRRLGLDWNSPPIPGEAASATIQSNPLQISVGAGQAE